MAQHKYKVIREHIGDQPYAPGDERVANPGDVGHLVPNVLKDLGPIKEEKADAKPKNKAEPKADNKAEKAGDEKEAG